MIFRNTPYAYFYFKNKNMRKVFVQLLWIFSIDITIENMVESNITQMSTMFTLYKFQLGIVFGLNHKIIS